MNSKFWSQAYKEGRTRWDIGYVSPPIKTYFDQLENKKLKILIPGGGNAYEAEYIHKLGFQNVYVVDLVEEPFQNLKIRYPEFPDDHLILGDFFDLDDQYDLIVEQTFFCALLPSLRESYVSKCSDLLKPGGKLIGLLFNIPLFENRPPFGGNKSEYQKLFEDYFEIAVMETSYNSIEPRQGNELFIILNKKSN